jgi:hypothetical protein
MISRTPRALSGEGNSVTCWYSGRCEFALSLGMALAYETESSPMNELKTGLLMLLVCAAFYVLADPRVWGGFCQFVGRLVGGVN